MAKHELWELKQKQALPLSIKLRMTQQRIREWVNEFGIDGVYVSFSGGKDSTVLLHIVREMYADVEAVFVNTGLEYPEIQKFVKTFDNVTILRPKMRFDEVIKKYGYPIISKDVAKQIHEVNASSVRNRCDKRETPTYKRRFNVDSDYCKKYPAFSIEKYKRLLDVDFSISHKCCDVMKKNPAKDFEKTYGKKPIVATMTSESRLRQTQWLNRGCNVFDGKRQISNPMSFWTEQDVLQYIVENNLHIASVYGEVKFENGKFSTTGCDRTGCIFCAFGCHIEKEPSRFQRLKETHPRQYEYCIGGGEYDEDGIWKPNKQGLGMGHVFDELNKIYGDGFIKYK